MYLPLIIEKSTQSLLDYTAVQTRVMRLPNLSTQSECKYHSFYVKTKQLYCNSYLDSQTWQSFLHCASCSGLIWPISSCTLVRLSGFFATTELGSLGVQTFFAGLQSVIWLVLYARLLGDVLQSNPDGVQKQKARGRKLKQFLAVLLNQNHSFPFC